MNRTIYLDHAAATPTRREVVNAMYPILTDFYGNPSSLHHKGREASALLEGARARVANLLGVTSGEIIFTSGGTEANNLALLGIAEAHTSYGKHILVSQIEHPSVLAAAERLSERGFLVEYIPVDREGSIHPEDVISRTREDTILISIMYANNEIGTVQPIQEIIREVRNKFPNHPVVFHTDACQAAGQLPIKPRDLGIDLMTINSGKIYGPKGVGILYVRSGVPFSPQIVGGNQESGHRAGTENVTGIIGFAEALEISLSYEVTYREKLIKLRDEFIGDIKKAIPDVVLNGPSNNRLPNNIHISIPYIEGESLLLLLDTYGICASTGSACSSHNLAPSHVLRAIKQPDTLIHGSIRFTLGEDNSREDMRYVVSALILCTERLRSISPLPILP